jgi:hypothetical protein
MKYINEETLIQASIIQWIRLQYPSVEIIHCPSEGKRGWTEQRKAKMLGLKKGVSDLILVKDNPPLLFLEIKIPGNRPTPEQFDVLDRMAEKGHSAMWCNSLDAAMVIINAWMEQ